MSLWRLVKLIDGADLAPVTNEKALEVLESTKDSAKLLKFTAALLGNKEIKDPLFQTWKCICIISDPLSSIIQNSESNIPSLPNPIPRASKAASKRKKPEIQYFVITADDVYNHKKTSAWQQKRRRYRESSAKLPVKSKERKKRGKSARQLA